jgi:hypothetical protein
MEISVLKRIVHAQPFRPFDLRMNDGREFDFRHPEFISVDADLVTVLSERDDSSLYLEPVLIASLRFSNQK